MPQNFNDCATFTPCWQKYCSQANGQLLEVDSRQGKHAVSVLFSQVRWVYQASQSSPVLCASSIMSNSLARSAKRLCGSRSINVWMLALSSNHRACDHGSEYMNLRGNVGAVIFLSSCPRECTILCIARIVRSALPGKSSAYVARTVSRR